MKRLFLLLFLFANSLICKMNYQIYPLAETIVIDLKIQEKILAKKIIQNLKYSIPATITYKIEFYQQGFIRDQLLASSTMVKTVEYDLWSGFFFLKDQNTISKTKDLIQLEQSLMQLEKISLIHTNQIEENKNYFFRIKRSTKNKNFHSYYHLVDNLLSIFKNQSGHYSSEPFLGSSILSNHR